MSKGVPREEYWEHEDGSLMLLEYLINNKDNNILDIDKEQINLIQSLILGEFKQAMKTVIINIMDLII